MKTPAERGPDGNWLVAAREARGFRSADAAREAIRKATGVSIGHSAYAGYESGSKAISANHRPVLVQFWGEPTQQKAPTSVGDIGALLTEMREANRINQQLVGVVAALVAGLSKERALTAEMFLAEGEGMTASVQAGLSLIREDIQSALASVSSLVLETSGSPPRGQK